MHKISFFFFFFSVSLHSLIIINGKMIKSKKKYSLIVADKIKRAKEKGTEIFKPQNIPLRHIFSRGCNTSSHVVLRNFTQNHYIYIYVCLEVYIIAVAGKCSISGSTFYMKFKCNYLVHYM